MSNKLIIWIVLLLSTNIALSQNISSNKVDPLGLKVAYLQDNDSLFVKTLNSDSSEVFITSGLKSNGNQRFLIWTKNGKNLIYEKDDRLYNYDLFKKESKIIDHKYLDSLVFFRFYLIRQVDISKDDILYFSAGLVSSKNQEFQLFKLDLTNGDIQKLTNDTLGVANISASEDGKYIAYSSYTIAKKWRAKINIISCETGNLISQSNLFDGTFFFGLDWSPDNRMILARNARGGEQIFNFNVESNNLEQVTKTNRSDQYLLGFFSNNLLYELEYEGNTKVYSLYNIYNGQKQEVIRDENISLSDLVRNDDLSIHIYFTMENRVQPIELFRIEVKDSLVSEKEIAHSFNKHNSLQGVKYKRHEYTNGNGQLSSVYLYFPKSYDSTALTKYPLIIMSYGGFEDKFPDFNYFLNEKLFTYLNKNYVIAFVNTRGTPSARQQQHYGMLQLQDTELFVDDVVEKYQINKNKVVVMGHSHGATMVYYFLTHSKIFAGGIAINGAADWIAQAKLKSMVGLPGSMGGTPEDLMELYTQYSPIENITSLEDPLLIFSGGLDTQIPAEINAQAFYAKSKTQNKDVKHHHFPDEGHLIEKSDNRTIFWNEIERFFQKVN